MRSRMSATSRTSPLASRGRQRVDFTIWASWSTSPAGPWITRARVSAICSQAQHRQPLAAKSAMALGKFLLDAVAERGDGRLGDVGIGAARLSGPNDALQLLHAHLEAPIVGPPAR